MTIRQTLTATDAPFLLALLFGVAGWGVTHVVSRTLESPIVELQTLTNLPGPPPELLPCSEPLSRDTPRVYLRLQNLSSKTRLENLHVLARSPATERPIVGVALLANPPTALGENKTETCTAEAAEGVVTELQPGASIVLAVGLSKPWRDDLLHLHVSSPSPVLVMPSGTITWLVRHESCIVLVLVGVSALLCILYLWFLRAD